VCLLVKNMPLDDIDRYGRMKDLLPMLLAAVDSKLNAIKAECALTKQSEEILTSFGQVRTRLYYLAKTLINKQEQSDVVLKSMASALHSDLFGMGLEEDQEKYLLDKIDIAIEEAADKIDASSIMHQAFSNILINLKQVSSKQDHLKEIFIEMNSVTINNELGDSDDNIELF